MSALIRETGARTAFAAKCAKFLCLLALWFGFATAILAAQATPAIATSTVDPDLASETLALARMSVQALFEHSGTMTCTETVTQFILDNEGRTAYQEHSVFSYRIQANTSGKSLQFVESRDPVEAAFRDRSRTVLITDGFGNMLLVLHPAYQRSFTFEADGDEVLNGVKTIRFRFRAVPGAPSPVMVQIRGENYSVSLEGTVWIEPIRGNVVKLSASSRSGMNELGIQSISSEITYLPATFHNPDDLYWMPASAVIDVEASHRHWRNVHSFSSYRRFDSASFAKDLPQN